ncbi:hypothetical protein FNYG_01611 [Fusarium nygamai]|uniref:Protein kinase domain-containing protein n=1 Tax=Gibberella nygamai TaxID=42673 RepID=A0A2K0WS77_GIBNY|nr:hypothetical protein FNYG_01611 [Fusarium nygamai]
MDHFHQYIAENLREGINGDGDKVSYVIPSALDSYWTERRVDIILKSQQPPVASSPDMIISDFPRVFSILTHIGQPQEISYFCRHAKGLDDHRLPFDQSCFPSTCKWAGDFLQNQWMFIPLFFPPHRILYRDVYPKTILPVTYQRKLTQKRGGRDTATLWEVQVHCRGSLTASEEHPVVFKVYEGTGTEDLYKAETDVYLKLRTKYNKYITQHLASFSFHGKGKHIIVLEYAAGGSLLDFFRNTSPPVSPNEFRLLWSRLLKLLDALHVLHDLYRPDGAAVWFLAGGHQDIQPANILVFPEKDKDSRFDVRFKLTEFGQAEIGRISTSGGKLATENRGNRMYISPESFANFSVQDTVRTDLPPSADIWALGAVFSDVLVWSICGEVGREQYRLRRRNEISSQRHMKQRDLDACFHDGVDRLAAVKESHELALQNKRGKDNISPCMSEVILDYMLTGVDERLSAMNIRIRAEKTIKNMKEDSLDDGQAVSSGWPGQPRISTNIRQSVPNLFLADDIGLPVRQEGNQICASPRAFLDYSTAGPSSPARSVTSSLRLWSDPEHTAGDTSLSTAPDTRDLGSGQGDKEGDPRTIEVYRYKSQPLHGDMETGDQEEIQSLVSPDDDIESLQSGTTPLRAYQIASKLLVERFLDDDRLLALYQQGVKRLDRTRFVNNHTTLMKQYFLDLRATAGSRAEEISVDFLRSRKERVRISSVIYDLVFEQGEQVRAKVKMEIEDNQESILLVDRFLAAQEIYDHDHTIYSDPESSDSSDDLPPQEKQTSQGETSKIEAVATFMTVGSAFDSYKYNLDEFLHPKKLGSDYRKAVEPPMASSEGHRPTPVGSQDLPDLGVVDPSVVLPETIPAAVETSYPYAKTFSKGLSWLMKITRPRVKEGYRRLEWTCDCGSPLYADFIVLDEERFRRFAELLQSPPPSESSQEMIADVQSSQGSSSREQGSPLANRGSHNTNSHIIPSSSARPSGADKSSNAIPRSSSGRGQGDLPRVSPESKSKYLALCVQTGPIYTTLEEVDTSSFKSDAALLEEMKNVYTRIRGVRSKYNSLFIPIGLEFVKFTLWNQKHGYISICDRPDSVPPKRQLEYDYDPKPLDFLPPMPAQVFLHYLEHGEEGWNKFRYLWLPKLPVRREKRIIEGHEASYGWGIHIIEGLNRWAIFALFLTTVFGSALAALLWSAIHNDIQGGTGLGQLIIALSSAVLTASLFRLRYL